MLHGRGLKKPRLGVFQPQQKDTEMTPTYPAALLVGLWIGPAWADLPGALDFVPTDAPLVISVPNLESAHAAMQEWAETFGVTDAQEALGVAQLFLSNRGIEAGGSGAVVLLEADFEADVPPAVVVLPMASFEEFVKGLGGQPVAGLNEIVTPFDMTLYARQLSDDFAVVGMDAELVEDFEGDAGQLEDHATLLGKTGSAVASATDLMLIANVAQLQDQLASMAEELKTNMADAMAMGGQAEQGEAIAELMMMVLENFARDAHVGLVGLDLGEAGMAFDLAANFKEGSELAGFFQDAGNAHGLLAGVPSTPYVFAAAMDYSSPSVRKLISGLQDAAGEMMNNPGGVDWFAMAEASEGVSMVMGTPAGGLMGGLFSGMVSYTKAKDPAGLIGTIRGLYADLDGEVQQGIEYATSYEREAIEINGTKVDSWSMDLSVDPNDPNAMAAQMALGSMQMMYPGGRPAGYLATTKTGVLQTMSKNSELIGKALAAAGNGGLSADERLAGVAAMLPEGRVGEFYVRVDQIVAMVGPMMAMMGGPALEADGGELDPIGVGLVANDGGTRAHVFVPTEVITMIQGMVAQMQGLGAAPGGEGAAGRPRF